MAFKVRSGIPRSTTFSYREKPTSGNVINGLGEQEKRRASHVFHNDGDDALPWDGLDRVFAYVNHWRVVLWILRNIWNLRKSTGPPAPSRIPVDDPAEMTDRIESLAKDLGADLVGVTSVRPDFIYEGHEVPYENAIAIGVSMNRERMQGIPDPASAAEVMRAYAKVGRIASCLSEEIRSWGWPARAYGNPNSGDLLHIPVAIECGFGQLGKHGSLISKEFGSNFRLGCVVTDLPLSARSSPVDIGVDDLCSRCNICVRDCPVDAIFDEKQMVRGAEKWYVDFDRCVFYFCETSGCGICIEVCPWSEDSKGAWLSERLLKTRERRKSDRDSVKP